VYGNDPALRAGLRDRRVGYVMAVSCDHRIPTNCGPVRADSVARGLPPVSRQRLSAGAGSKGQRMYSWAYLSLPSDETDDQWILMRRNDSTGDWRSTGVTARSRCRWVSRRSRVAGTPWSRPGSWDLLLGDRRIDRRRPAHAFRRTGKGSHPEEQQARTTGIPLVNSMTSPPALSSSDRAWKMPSPPVPLSSAFSRSWKEPGTALSAAIQGLSKVVDSQAASVLAGLPDLVVATRGIWQAAFAGPQAASIPVTVTKFDPPAPYLLYRNAKW